jgi:hypothetical protein
MITCDELRVLRARREVVELARAMLRGEISVLLGARRMQPYRWKTAVDERDEDFLAFVSIESQEDHLPVGRARQNWSAAALARLEPELRDAEAFHRPAALKACESLVTRFTASAAPVLQQVGSVPADSDLHLVPANLAERSLSARELVLPYPQVLDALDALERRECGLSGWEGWIRYPDGRVGHSARHQGMAGMESLARSEAYRLVRAAIEEAQDQWVVQPESPRGELYFCISAANP